MTLIKSIYTSGLQLADRGLNLTHEAQTIGLRSSAKMLKKIITVSLKSILLHY